jgi:type IX secretion system PorP/SprF family membrane protein
MKIITLYIALTCALLFSVKRISAQDFHLSMYDAAPLFLNPSMTGVFDADWRLHLQYRTQWKSVNFKPYTTGLVSFDMPYKKWGFGAQVGNFRAGIGNYNAFQAVGSAAYTVSLDAAKAHNLTMGAQAGFTQKSIEYQLHTFNNQYVTTNGGGFDNGLNSNESFVGQAIFVPVTNAGILYYYARQQSKLNPFFGISAFNLIEPQETFFGGENNLTRRFFAHIGTRINITELFYLLPKVLVMNQAPFNEQTYALDAGYYLKSSELHVLGGLIYRNADAFILTLGLRRDNYIARIGYDINTSSLAPSTTGRGGFEISFTYMKQKPKPVGEKICPRI